MSLQLRTAVCVLSLLVSYSYQLGAQQPTGSPPTDSVAADSVSSDSASKAAPPQSAIPLEYVTVAKLIKAAYPDLSTKGLSYVFSMQGDNVFVRITEPVELSKAAQSDNSPALLNVEAIIHPDQHLVRLSASGMLTKEDKNKELSDQVLTNPKQPDAQVGTLISASDAKNGPSQPPDVTEKFDAARWSNVLGQQFTSSIGQFQLTGITKGGDATAKPGWIVNASAQDKDGKVHSYRIRLEPFDGQVVEIEEQQ